MQQSYYKQSTAWRRAAKSQIRLTKGGLFHQFENIISMKNILSIHDEGSLSKGAVNTLGDMVGCKVYILRMQGNRAAESHFVC